jgi:hypothetical protein
MKSNYWLADGARNETNQTMKRRAGIKLSVSMRFEIQSRNWPNEALEGRRLLVTDRACARSAPSNRLPQLER